jgi:DNA-binding LytR/AlgR family response regulator
LKHLLNDSKSPVDRRSFRLRGVTARVAKLPTGAVLRTQKVVQAFIESDYEHIRKLLLTLDHPKSFRRYIPLRRGKKIVLMNPGDMHFLKSEQGVTIVVTQSGEYWTHYTLNEIEAILDDQMFFRTHRSTIVNLSKIKEMVPAQSGLYDVFLTDAKCTCVPLSRHRARVLREKYDF